MPIKAKEKNFGLSENDFNKMVIALKRDDKSLFEKTFLAHFKDCMRYLQQQHKATRRTQQPQLKIRRENQRCPWRGVTAEHNEHDRLGGVGKVKEAVPRQNCIELTAQAQIAHIGLQGPGTSQVPVEMPHHFCGTVHACGAKPVHCQPLRQWLTGAAPQVEQTRARSEAAQFSQHRTLKQRLIAQVGKVGGLFLVGRQNVIGTGHRSC